jgi:protein phosphatase
VQLRGGGASDPGPRASNQDAYLVDLDLGLVVVADGMGGHNAGEVASRMAVEAVAEFIRATQEGRQITWPFPFHPERSPSFNRIEAAIRLANQLGHAGDSRAYLYRDGELLQRTRDHTWVNAVLESGEDLQNHPFRHVLTNGVGMGEELSPSMTEEQLQAGDRWLVCTDGVHGSLAHEVLRRIMTIPEAEDAARETVRCAVAAGTNDNATAVVLNVE